MLFLEYENKYLENMFFCIRILGVLLMLIGITAATLHRFFDIHIFNVSGITYFTGLLGILLVEFSAFLNLRNTQRFDHDR